MPYRHECYSAWDGLEIDEGCVEFAFCECFPETEEFLRLRDVQLEKCHVSDEELAKTIEAVFGKIT